MRRKQPYSNNLFDIQTNPAYKPIVIVDFSPSGTIVIDDSDNTKLSTHAQWLKIGGNSLYDFYRRIIAESQWLWGTHLSVVQF